MDGCHACLTSHSAYAYLAIVHIVPPAAVHVRGVDQQRPEREGLVEQRDSLRPRHARVRVGDAQRHGTQAHRSDHRTRERPQPTIHPATLVCCLALSWLRCLFAFRTQTRSDVNPRCLLVLRHKIPGSLCEAPTTHTAVSVCCVNAAACTNSREQPKFEAVSRSELCV
jgi:hypothetical protein